MKDDFKNLNEHQSHLPPGTRASPSQTPFSGDIIMISGLQKKNTQDVRDLKIIVTCAMKKTPQQKGVWRRDACRSCGHLRLMLVEKVAVRILTRQWPALPPRLVCSFCRVHVRETDSDHHVCILFTDVTSHPRLLPRPGRFSWLLE